MCLEVSLKLSPFISLNVIFLYLLFSFHGMIRLVSVESPFGDVSPKHILLALAHSSSCRLFPPLPHTPPPSCSSRWWKW